MAEAETPNQNEEVTPEPVVEEKHTSHSHKNQSHLARFKTWYADRKKWTIPASVLLLVLLLAAVPFTRYNLAGLVVKRDFTMKLVDSTAKTPVSGATITIGSQSVESDGTGKVRLHVNVGNREFHISKKYYAPGSANLLVPILKQKDVPIVGMSA